MHRGRKHRWRMENSGPIHCWEQTEILDLVLGLYSWTWTIGSVARWSQQQSSGRGLDGSGSQGSFKAPGNRGGGWGDGVALGVSFTLDREARNGWNLGGVRRRVVARNGGY